MSKSKLLFVLFFFSVLNINAQEFHGKKKDIQIILSNINNFSKYFVNGEADKIADCYTLDGKIFPNNSDIIEGIKAIKERWTLPPDVKTLRHKVTPVEIKIIKKYAYDYGYYEGATLNAAGETIPWKGKYVIVWRKEKKDWKIYLDIWNNIPIE